MNKLVTLFITTFLSAAAMACQPPPSLAYERNEVPAVMDSRAFSEALTEMNDGFEYGSAHLNMTITHGIIGNQQGDTGIRTVTVNLDGNRIGKNCTYIFGITYKDNPDTPCGWQTHIESVERISKSCK